MHVYIYIYLHAWIGVYLYICIYNHVEPYKSIYILTHSLQDLWKNFNALNYSKNCKLSAQLLRSMSVGKYTSRVCLNTSMPGVH